jgi:hypothetical protein
MIECISELGWTPGDPRVKFSSGFGMPAEKTSIEQYIRDKDWSKLLGDSKEYISVKDSSNLC